MTITPTLSFITKKAVPLFLSLCLITALIPSKLAFADANKLYITPASSQMNVNTIFTINVRTYADSDQTSGTALGNMTYPTNQLKVTGISVSGSGYGSPSITQGTGVIGFNASRTPAPSGTAQLFAVTFQAIGAGVAQVGFMDNSRVNGVATTYDGGTYTIIDPTPPPASTSPTPKTSVSPKPTPVVIDTTPSPTPTTNNNTGSDSAQTVPDPTGLIDNVNVNPLYSTSTITWTVNANNPTAELAYGLDSSQLDKHATVTKKADGSFTTTITGLTPGLRYAFTINATGQGVQNATYSGAIAMQGFPVTLTITENGQPVQSGQVKIGNLTSLITTPGKLTVGLAAGSYSGTITTDTASLAINLTVVAKSIPADGSAPDAQPFSFNMTSSNPIQGPGSGFAILTFIGVLFGGAVLLALGFVGFMAYRRRQFESGGSAGSYSSSPSVIIDDGYDWKSQTDSTDRSTDTQSANTSLTPGSENTDLTASSPTEEEPYDMFDKDKNVEITTKLTGSESTSATEHTPNSPHSTTP